MKPNPHISLPLETLLRMLGQRGFRLTPDLQVRVQKVLITLGKEKLSHPADLATVLCPLLAQDEGQQELFYEVFDQWLEVHVQPPEEKETPVEPVEIRQDRLKWQVPAVISGIVTIILMGLGLWWWLVPPEELKPKTHFYPEAYCVGMGKPLKLTNETSLSGVDTGNGMSDQPLTFRKKVSTKDIEWLWDYGDGNTDSVEHPEPHIYTQSGPHTIRLTAIREGIDSTYEVKVFVAGASVPDASFSYGNEGRIYTFTPDNINPGWEYRWDIGDGKSASIPKIASNSSVFEGEFGHSENLYVILSVWIPVDTAGLCNATQAEILDLRQELVQPNPLKPYHDDGEFKGFAWRNITWILWPMVCLLAGFLYWANYRYQRRMPDDEGFMRIFRDSSGPPVELPFPSQDEILSSQGDIHALATTLRQGEMGERKFLDIDASLRKTIRQGGYPQLAYRQMSRPVEYLALIESEGPEDQQAKLFAAFLDILRGEQVPVEVWYFQHDLSQCYRPGREESISLNRLGQLFAGHRLMIFGKGETLLDPRTSSLRPGLESLLPLWDERALLTPLPVGDWSRREQMLREYFAILPADLEGQLGLMEALQEDRTADFRTLQRRLIRNRLDEPVLMDYDLANVYDLRAYLGERRFRWLAAAALYPRPVWELTLAMASGLDKTKEGEVTYEDLLLLTRIPWLRDGDLSEDLRGELIDSLDEETEREARQILLRMLELADVPEHSYAALEKETQRSVNLALLKPEDKRYQKGLEVMFAKGLLDPATRSQVRKSASKGWKDIILHLALLLALQAGGLGLLWINNVAPKGQMAGLAYPRVDSLAEYINLAGEAIENRNYDLADEFLSKAIDLNPSYAPARYQLDYLNYRTGLEAYQIRDWENVEDELVNGMSETNQFGSELDTLYWHRDHTLGLAYYYDEKIDSAIKRMNMIPQSFFGDFGTPNLQTLLRRYLKAEELQRVIANALQQADFLFINASGINTLEAWQSVRDAYQQILAIDPGNVLARTRVSVIEEEMERIARKFNISGRIRDVRTGEQIVRASIIVLEDTFYSDELGLFEATGFIKNIVADSQISLSIAANGYQYGNITLPYISENVLIKLVPNPNIKDIPIPEMVFIKGGTFDIGSEDFEDARPVHKVTLDDFWIGKYEVTNKEFAFFLNAYGSDKVRDGEYEGKLMIEEHKWGLVKNNDGTWAPAEGKENHPVIQVSWFGGNEYARWLSKQTGQDWRLPTEAQWEYVAGGGADNRTQYIGTNDQNDFDKYYWHYANFNSQTHPVGLKSPVRIGDSEIYDLGGNVWEWCGDWYDETYYQTEQNWVNPVGPISGQSRVVRGGSWNTFGDLYFRPASRNRYNPNLRDDFIGLRLSRY